MITDKILFVDDNPNILSSLRRQLGRNFNLETADSGKAALDVLKSSGPFAVVISDQKMPAMDGIEFLKRVTEFNPDIVRVMLTGNADQTTAIAAVNEGQVFQFLTKPYAPEDLEQTLRASLENYRLRASEKQLLNDTLNGVTTILGDLLSVLDPEIHARQQTIKEDMKKMLRQLNVRDAWEFELTANLASIGFVTLPEEIKAKVKNRETLSESEQKVYAIHPVVGYELLAKIPRMGNVAKGVLYQDKNFDGSGAPLDNVKGEDIPLTARLLHVLKDLQGLEAEGVDRIEALNTLREIEGAYDPELLELIGAITDYRSFPQAKEDTQASGPANATAQEKPKFTKPVSIGVSDLRIGHIVVKEVKAENGVLILKPGNVITDVNLQRIQNYHRYSGIIEPIVVVTRVPQDE
ncbi:MAG: response regulator [Bdellovibrionales bacterium]|nr:response regulator [Bdellovibrionales bacterium]